MADEKDKIIRARIIKESQIQYHYLVDQTEREEIQSGAIMLSSETGTIESAYFGRHPTPSTGERESPLGLNLTLQNRIGNFGITYTDQKEIDKIMDRFHADEPEHLMGKVVKMYIRDARKIIGISPIKW